MSLVDSALKYAKLKWSVIPLKKDKTPYIKWLPYQKKRADTAQIKEWWEKHPRANIGIVTGAISGLVVIDIDSPVGLTALEAELGEVPATISQRTGKEGGKQGTGCLHRKWSSFWFWQVPCIIYIAIFIKIIFAF